MDDGAIRTRGHAKQEEEKEHQRQRNREEEQGVTALLTTIPCPIHPHPPNHIMPLANQSFDSFRIGCVTYGKQPHGHRAGQRPDPYQVWFLEGALIVTGGHYQDS